MRPAFFFRASSRINATANKKNPGNNVYTTLDFDLQNVASGSGGGGRIAVWCGAPWSASLRKSRKVISETPLTGYPESMSYLGSYSAANGPVLGDYGRSNSTGTVGTVRFCYTKPPSGVMLILR